MSDARDVDAERAGNEAGVVNRAELQAAERTIAKVRALAAYSTDGRGSAIPLDWPEYRAALLALHGDGAELVIELVREAGYMARMAEVGVVPARASEMPSYARVAVAGYLRHRASMIRCAASSGLDPDARSRQLSRAHDYEMAADEIEHIQRHVDVDGCQE